VNPLGLLKAEYLFRPSQVARRLLGPRRGDFVEAVLPWGAKIRVRPADAIGSAVLALGVYDLPVTEALLRLADPGEVAADVGANIGCMTAALARAVGPAGAVWAFEPHPELFEELRANAARWAGPAIELRQAALSRATGRVALGLEPAFDGNRGVARVVEGSARGPSVDVDATTLDAVFASARAPDVLKLDVEGHELAVLEGAAGLLGSGRVRDIVFEEHASYPSPVALLLESRGYALRRIARGLTRVVLREKTSPPSRWEAASLLATRDPARAESRFRAFGWRALEKA
jgi:FkbM family methyltransferase